MGLLTQIALSPLDLMNMPDPPVGEMYELSDGELVTVGKAFFRHEMVKSRITALLNLWAVKEGGFQIFSESLFPLGPHTARMPDVAVVSRSKLEPFPEEDILIPFVPDLAVEVISISESALDAEKKVRQYLQAGVEEVWQVYPEERMVCVRRPSSTVDVLANQLLTSVVLPGFEGQVGSLFTAR